MPSVKSRSQRAVAGVVAVAAMSVSLTACGSSAPKPVASIDALKGESTAIKLAPSFAKALKKLKLTPGVLGSAKLKKGSLIFPITGGNVTYFKPGTVSPYVIGQIQHQLSGFSLSAGGTQVNLVNFNVDPGASRVYGDVKVNGKVAATDAYLFALDGRTLKPLKSKKKVAILQGTKVKISKVAAPLLNKTFKTKAVKPGLLVGTAKITIRTK